jgi:hypothetical protein
MDDVRLELLGGAEDLSVCGSAHDVPADLSGRAKRVAGVLQAKRADLVPRVPKQPLLKVCNHILPAAFPVAGVNLEDSGQASINDQKFSFMDPVDTRR